MAEKTAVSLLQEFCQKQNQPIPKYEEGLADGAIFTFYVQAFDKRTVGTGKTKISAKHDAAEKMLFFLKQDGRYATKLAGKEPSAPKLEVEHDAVGVLISICLQKCLPSPQFPDNVLKTGPPHDPQFTAYCRWQTYETSGKFSTKKKAKQIAAQNMLQIVKDLFENQKETEAVASMEVDPPEAIWQKYRKFRFAGIKPNPTRLIERQSFFQRLPDAIRRHCYNLFNGFDAQLQSERELVDSICQTLNMKYDIQDIPGHPARHKMFLLHGGYDCVLIEHEDNLYGRIIDYFKTMMSFQRIAV